MKKLVYTIAAIFTAAAAFAQPCSDLFISEYIEGSSNNKALEIYNPTAGPINLAGYELRNYFNGNSSVAAEYVLPLAGIIPAGGTFTVVNPSANATLIGLADTLTPATGAGRSVANFNGDDAIALFNGANMIDVFGLIGTDPGASWVYGTFTTVNKTLVRKATIQEGTTAWDSTIAVNNWDVYDIDDFSFFGDHTMNACSGVLDTLVKFSATSATVSEASGSTSMPLVYNPVSPVTSFTASVVLKSGNAADIGNYTTQTATFTANSNTTTVPVTITDNALIDGNKTFVFALRNPSSGMLLGTDTLFTLTVADDDAPVIGPPVYTIAQVRGTNANGGPDSLNVTCELRGTVYGVNYRPGGLEFTINDGTAGISVYAPVGANTFGYTVTEGDSIRVWGDVITFRGLAQIAFLDTIIPAGQGNLMNPMFVSTLGENTESALIRANGCTLVNAAQWTQGGNSFNVDCLCNGQAVKVRIHQATTAINAVAPVGTFDVIGIGSQFATTTTAPFADGYQLIPRKIEDILYGGSISENEASAGMNIFPNPSNGAFTVSFDTQESGMAQVSVKDISGRTISMKNVALNSGSNQISMNENLSAGIYLVQLTINGTTAIQRVVIK